MASWQTEKTMTAINHRVDDRYMDEADTHQSGMLNDAADAGMCQKNPSFFLQCSAHHAIRNCRIRMAEWLRGLSFP